MLVKKFWFGKKRKCRGYSKPHRKAYCGWFLFGIIPLYIRELEE